MVRLISFSIFLALFAFGNFQASAQESSRLPGSDRFPADHHSLTHTISFSDMKAFLDQIDGKGPVKVTVEGRSAANRPVYLVHLNRGGEKAAWRVLFYAQQHGDEVSGKDALLYMIRTIVEKPESLPESVDLWIMPMLNPDGAEANSRRNDAGADLNRDHLSLLQPETQALYRVCRRVLPHIAVDCHEFTRDSSDYRDRGWTEWPLIMMDGLNHPLFDEKQIKATQRWVEGATPIMEKAGHAYMRYVVGDAPPDGELRHSAPDPDDGRNGIGAYGGLSFIIEAGVSRSSANPDADLAQRVDAYLGLLWPFIRDDRHRRDDMQVIQQARQSKLPAFIPTNCFWGNVGPRVTDFPVIDQASGLKRLVPTANFMHDLIVKKSVQTPWGYAVDSSAAEIISALLDRHGIHYERLSTARTLSAERCKLIAIESEFDDVYNRYQGRQIVQREPAAPHEFPSGALIVSLNQEAGLRAVLVLEPTMLYGLFQYAPFKALVGPDGICPVWRVMNGEEKPAR